MQMAATPISSAPSAGKASSHINLSTPAGWALLYWIIAVGIIAFLFFTV